MTHTISTSQASAPNPGGRLWLTVGEFSRLTGMSRGAVYQRIRRGTIPTKRLGRTHFISAGYAATLDHPNRGQSVHYIDVKGGEQ